jgi:hypothetical protein
MIRSSSELERFERDDARLRLATMTHAEALAIFEALWDEAVALNPDFPGDWRDDIAADLSIARAINGLPPDA